MIKDSTQCYYCYCYYRASTHSPAPLNFTSPSSWSSLNSLRKLAKLARESIEPRG